mmetsp:Transcript_16402/g.46963  ORF Transcript_16402/g.46963 Transcript_16402/m.46963 type:complete len:579 (+) Transcript_16402:223-1959(+)
MSSSPLAISSTMGRKRSFSKAGFLIASAVALSLSGASTAFQSSLASLDRGNQARSAATMTQLAVVTDPKDVLLMELKGRDGINRRVLEELYLIATTDSDGLSGEMVEGVPSRRRSKVRTKAKIKMTSPPPEIEGYGDTEDMLFNEPSRVQFKGLSTGRDGRTRRDSLSRTPPTPRSVVTSTSRSSTMPGFIERGSTDRQRAYEDGIKLAEQRTGKKFVETDEAKKKRRKVNGESMYKSSASVPDSLVQFANEIHDVERITPKEEIELGEKTQEAIRLQKVFDGLEMQLAREPTDEEWCAAAGKINMEALSQAIDEGLEAKNKLVTSNLRMVQGVVNVYIRNGLRGHYNAADLMQEGIMALIRAAEKFDPSRGFRFSTYAMYWIRSSIKRGQIMQSRVVTVPQRLYENHKRVMKVQAQMIADLGRAPTKKELAKAVDMTEVQLDRCLIAMGQRCYSLDQQISNPLKPLTSAAREDTMYDLVESKTDDRDYNKQTHMFLREDLISMLESQLSEEEVYLLLLRYGLLDSADNLKNGPLTIAEVSRLVGYKPDKVRRIINRSLKHMKAVIGNEWVEYERELQ